MKSLVAIGLSSLLSCASFAAYAQGVDLTILNDESSTGDIIVPIDLDESAQPVWPRAGHDGLVANVWTGTSTQANSTCGAAVSAVVNENACQNWTSQSDTDWSRLGRTYANQSVSDGHTWTSVSGGACNVATRLYCFQQ